MLTLQELNCFGLSFFLFLLSVLAGVDMCGRTVMVVVGRNIPVTLLDLEKVALRSSKLFWGVIWLIVRVTRRRCCTSST